MKKSKIFQFAFIILCAILIIYVYFIHNRADTLPVNAYVDDSMYEVYSGKNVYEYHRETLDDTEKIVYEEIKESFLQFQTELSTQVDKLTKEQLDNAFVAVVLDHPEIFWINSYAATINIFGNVNTNKLIMLRYTYSKADAIKEKNKIAATYESIINDANEFETEYEKIKFVHDKLIEIGNYRSYSENERADFQSIISIFDTGDTVCAGFSYGFKFIMDNLGIKAIAFQDIDEKDNSNSHIWNTVYVYDKWLNIDITWDNQETHQDISYKYFLLENDEFYKNHTMPKNVPNN